MNFRSQCLGLTDDSMSNQTMQDINDDIEDLEFDRMPLDSAIIRLQNGGYAFGSQVGVHKKLMEKVH